MKLTVITDTKIPKNAIVPAPGFAKKGLAHAHWERQFRCTAACLYCSTNVTLPMNYGKGRLMRLAAEQVPGVTWDHHAEVSVGQDGTLYDPTRRPEVAVVWDVEAMYQALAEQIAAHGPEWGAGRTLMVSQLTDPLFEPASQRGFTLRALSLILDKTKFRLRMLTKNEAAGRGEWLRFFVDHRDRVVVGLSIGSLDDGWAAKMEGGTSHPTLRVRAVRALQEAGVPTFTMACPVFPQVAHDREALRALFAAVRPELGETVWVEPANNRASADAEREVYDPSTRWRAWYDRVYPPMVNGRRAKGATAEWSAYATTLYEQTVAMAREGGWLDRLIYLLYEQDITPDDAAKFASLGFAGLSLQAKPREDGKSINPAFAAFQGNATMGRTVKVAGPKAVRA